jgi:DNA topoisomerase-1
MRPNPPTLTNIACPDCKPKNKSNKLRITNGSSGTFLGCQAYNYEGDEQCKKTLNLVHGDEAVSIDDQEEAEHLISKRRCSKCDLSMDNYLLDENHKLHVCSNNPDCDGFEVEEGTFKIKGYDGPTLSCHKCGSEMQLKTGRFGKYFGCMNDNCGTTRALQRNGEPKPIVMEPITTEIPCIKFEDIYLLRDSMKGLFLAASKYPKNRETRAPSVEEFNLAVSEETLLNACQYLEDQAKHTHLLAAPKEDIDGNPYIIRYNKVEDTHYLASEKGGKKTGNTATHNGDKWVEATK